MGNYKGYFRRLDKADNGKGTLFSVSLLGEPNKTSFTEILLAGDSPFVVTYNTSDTIFEPVRTSTATIRIVHNNYLEDILTSHAQGTQVILKDETNNVIEWVGYLTPMVYDQSYVEEYETIELEAADCVSSLQYIEYEHKKHGGFITFKEMIDYICDTCGLLEGYYWTRSKKLKSGAIMLPKDLMVSESNWGYSDVEENLKLNEVLSEICQYLGFTCLQWKNRMYFIDYQYYHTNNDIYATWFAKATDYGTGSSSHLGGIFTVTADEYMGTGANISFAPIYNKITVKANFSSCDDVISGLFDDEYLTNRNGDFYANEEVMPVQPYRAEYPHGGVALLGSIVSYATDKEKKDCLDDKYRYFMRLYDHKDWESVYRNDNGVQITPTDINTTNVTKVYRGGTIVDLGVVRKEYSNEYQQWIVPNNLDYTRYLCICERTDAIDNGTIYGDTSHNLGAYFRLKEGTPMKVMLSNDAYLVISASAIFEKYPERNYINPDWGNGQIKQPAGASGQHTSNGGKLNFKIKIGDKCWDGYQWTTGDKTFTVALEKSSKDTQWWNQTNEVLNNISWELYIDEKGYKIPLAGMDLTMPITIEIHKPANQWRSNTGSNKFHNLFPEVNAYCWLKDLSIKVVESGQDVEKQESDVIYENIIDEKSINELSDITVKLTSFVPYNKPSYSNVIAVATDSAPATFLEGLKEDCLSGVFQKPEENIVERYVSQYDTPTKSVTLSLDSSVSPLQAFKGVDVDNLEQKYCALGSEIDYAMDRQTITVVEKK